jgi:hypothetical protein
MKETFEEEYEDSDDAELDELDFDRYALDLPLDDEESEED